MSAWGLPEHTGPVHQAQPHPHERLSWCGKRRQYRHVGYETEEVTCTKCLNQVRKGRPMSWGAR